MSEEDAETSGLNGNADEQNVKKEGKSPEAEFDESQVESNTIEHPPPDVQDSDTGVKTETGELVGEAVHKSTFLTSGEEDTVEATAQADLPEDSRQDEASPKKTTFSNEVGNSTATGKKEDLQSITIIIDHNSFMIGRAFVCFIMFLSIIFCVGHVVYLLYCSEDLADAGGTHDDDGLCNWADRQGVEVSLRK